VLFQFIGNGGGGTEFCDVGGDLNWQQAAETKSFLR
jgi:hypothetical protein